MHRRTLAATTAGLALAIGGTSTAIAVTAGAERERSPELARAIDAKPPRNVILLVGDGTGESELTAARYYQGVGKKLALDSLPFRGVATTYAVRDRKGSPDYAPDSASTATAWSTGVKTLDNRISQRPTNRITTVGGNNLPTTIELAKAAGKRTGNVSTAEITDATPAAPTSHISQRACQGPQDTAKSCPAETRAVGGKGSIAEQQVRLRADVTLGGGRARYEQLQDNGRRTTLQQAEREGYQVVGDAAGLQKVRSVRTAPVLGLFTSGNMTTELAGPQAALGGNTATCKTGNRPANEPALADMTSKAIELLDQGNRKGFFLQVEGGSIDKQNHAANPCGQIGETLALDKAVAVAQEYQRKNPDTLIVVSADHSHTSQIVPDESTGDDAPTGYSQTLRTADGQPLRIAYGTAGGAGRPTPAPSQEHTGAAVPVLASGPQGANATGTIDQTDLYPLLTSTLRR